MAEKTLSKVSPRGGKRGCLCKDGKYRKECCDGSLEAQGIGKTTGTGTDVVNTTENNGVRTIVRQNG
jgi:hypothetical protein